MSADAEALVDAQRARGYRAGVSWAEEQPVPVSRPDIIREADRRWPDTMSDFIASFNLSGGFIDGAEATFANSASAAPTNATQ